MWQVADDLASPVARSKLSEKLSEAALTSDCGMKNRNSARVLTINDSLDFLRLSVDAFSDGQLVRTLKSGASEESSNEVPNDVPDEHDGEKSIEIQANDQEDHVVEFGNDNVLMCAFDFMDTVTKLLDEFKDRLTIKSVESKIYEQKKPIEKKRVYYAKYPTGRKNDHRGGIIYGAHPTQCRQPRK
ncbi:hypothetical protein M3Y94_00438900 [Aphelenchoides besseyi]|nr:hypothetical protein M3Y94_00438900 [Aphelenchoides besseyi]